MYSKNVQNYNTDLKLAAELLRFSFPIKVSRPDPDSAIYADADKHFDESVFATARKPIAVKPMSLMLPKDQQHILRMPLRHKYVWNISADLRWLKPLFEAAESFQHSNFNTYKYPFVYLTVRHGEQKEVATDVWHTDGFQGKRSERHIGEISYIWTSDAGTEWSCQGIDIPQTFDPAQHNFFSLFEQQKFVDTMISNPKTLYCFDSYSLHRKIAKPGNRTMIRLTFSPVEIKDPNYSASPFFALKYDKPEPRDTLIPYAP